MIQKTKIYISSTTDPYQNLATEKYLLDTTEEDCCTLYLWQNQKTVVIGKNQNPWAECQCKLLEREGGKLARRLSGGGAVFHDFGNLNFTFLCSTENFDVEKQLTVVQAACKLTNINTEISGRNDILADGRKFSGNAFYHAKGKSYHHGTILVSTDFQQMARYLTPSKAKLEAKGIKSVRSRTINLSQLSPGLTCHHMQECMITAFQQVYQVPCSEISPIANEKIAFLANKYSSWEYLYGTTIPFTTAYEKRFNWGQANLHLNIQNGEIHSAKLYTDAMDVEFAPQVEQALLNCRFDLEHIKERLFTACSNEIAEDLYSLLKDSE